MQQKPKKIGISGGTFDPVHYGHLIIAEEVKEQFELDKVIFVPSGMPPHKDNLKVSNAEHRFEMVQKAIENNPFFDASRIEIDREGYTFTIDTLKLMYELYGRNVRLFYIIGADVVQDLLTWKNYKEVFDMCEFIAVNRQGFIGDFSQRIEYLKNQFNVKISVANVPLIEISSTAIRHKAANAQSIRYLLPESVREYIIDRKLYHIE